MQSGLSGCVPIGPRPNNYTVLSSAFPVRPGDDTMWNLCLKSHHMFSLSNADFELWPMLKFDRGAFPGLLVLISPPPLD